MKTIYITEAQKKKLKKAVAAQDQVGGKVNAGVMDGVVGGMCEGIENNNLETWYRGYNSKYGSDRNNLLWLTDDIDYAKSYGNRVEEVVINTSKLVPTDDIDDTWFPSDKEIENSILEGFNCYYFIANDDSDCLCLFDKSAIVSRRELSEEEFNTIEGYDELEYHQYNDIYENIEDDKYELGAEKGDISPYYHVNESNEETITLYHGVNRKGLEFNLEQGAFIPRVCSEGGPKAIWLSEKQYNYEFTFAFDFPKSEVEQLSNVDYIFTNKISFNDFNCRLVRTSISSYFDDVVVETNILNDKLSKLHFRYFPDLGIELWKEFKQYPNILERFINPYIEKYQQLGESININKEGKNNIIENKKKVIKNDKGEIVPDKCDKCGGEVVLQIHGEPVYICKNCGKYFGTMPFHIKENKLNENIELEIKPDEVDLSSFNIKKKLNPKFWIDGHLDSRIRLKLLDISDDFIEYLGIDPDIVKDVIMTGSLANFNWNEEFSDIDLHVLLDYSDVDENTEFVKQYFMSQKNLWNNEHQDLKIFGFPIEVYVQDVNEKHDSSGVYSLDRDKWLREPDRDVLASSKVNKEFIRNKVSDYVNKIDKLLYIYKKAKNDEYKLRKLSEKVEKLWDEIKNNRKHGFEKSGGKEINNLNIVFKTLKRLGYLDKLYDLKTKTYDKLMSL